DGGTLDTGVFAFAGASATHIDSIYVVKALTQDGHLYRPGIVSGHNIVVAAAEPVAPSPKLIYIEAITDLSGGPFDPVPVPANGDQHHIDILTNASITEAEKTGDLRVGRILSTGQDASLPNLDPSLPTGNFVTLKAQARIIDAVNDKLGTDADVGGVNITLI